MSQLRKEIRDAVVNYYQPDELRPEKSKGAVLFADLNATTSGFQVINWEINPANSALFPRLAPVAQMWSKYRVREVVVEFIPAGGVFSTPGKQGNLILFWTPNVFEAEPANFKAASQAAKRSVIHLTKSRTVLRLTERDQDLAGIPWLDCGRTSVENSDAPLDPSKLFMGKLGVAWSGIDVSVTNPLFIGRLEMTYHIDLAGQREVNSLSILSAEPSMTTAGNTVGAVALTTGVFNSVNMAATSNGTTLMKSEILPSPYSGFKISGGDVSTVGGHYLLRFTVEFTCTSAAITLGSVRVMERNTASEFVQFDDAATGVGIMTITGSIPFKSLGAIVGIDVAATFGAGTCTYLISWSITRV